MKKLFIGEKKEKGKRRVVALWTRKRYTEKGNISKVQRKTLSKESYLEEKREYKLS